MARKVKFALEMADGTKVRNNLEELREHFDMESIARYYLSGKLLEWLEDRYYDDEAAKIEELDKDAPNLNAQLCAIIGVDASKYDALDLEAVERLNEKKTFLRQKTSDSTIIDNAMITALNQEDLADLLDLESPVIYLCGEKFNIPIRVEHKKYIGVLGTPKIEIRATSDADLKAKDIIFENVLLPWEKTQTDTKPKPLTTETPDSTCSNEVATCSVDQLFALYKSVAISRYNNNSIPVWEFIDRWGNFSRKVKSISNQQKSLALMSMCRNKYKEDDIVKAFLAEDFSSGCIFTADSVCLYDKKSLTIHNAHNDTSYIIPYNEITMTSATPITPDDIKKDSIKLALAGDIEINNLKIVLKNNIEVITPTKDSSTIYIWYLADIFANYLNLAKNISPTPSHAVPSKKTSPSIHQESVLQENQIIDEKFEMLTELYHNVLGTIKYGGNEYPLDRWMFVNDTNTACSSRDLYINTKSDITELQKKLCLKIICNNKYTDSEIIHAHMNSTGSYGWMLTKDSFCVGGGNLEKIMIKYADIEETDFESYSGKMDITTYNDKYNLDWCGYPIVRSLGNEICEFLKGAATITSDN